VTVACAGIGVASGASIAFGKAFALNRGPLCIAPSWISEHAVETEVIRFLSAVRTAGSQLRDVRETIPVSAPPEIADFIDTHLLMLEDRALSSRPIELIREQRLTAESALQQHRDALVQVFEQVEDTYLRTRRNDLDHVVNRIMDILLDQNDAVFDEMQDCIVLAEDLSPADLIVMKNHGIAGFVTDFGGPMSHTAILARSLGIPGVVGARGASRCLVHGETLVLDAAHGIVLADCDEALLASFSRQQSDQRLRTARLQSRGDALAVTRDGVEVHLTANIELADDVRLARANGAQGIGLYRTEFLYMNRSAPPSEQDHLDAYREVVEGMAGRSVTIRTLDLGADKQPYGEHGGMPTNPAMGLRAIRLCLKEPELFMPQIRAILRASAFGPVRLMLPMLTSVWEIEQTERIIGQAMQQLEQRGMAFDRDLPIGGMIEVPAAALHADAFAERLDFLSIGTNDLIQYTLAIDRVDDEINYLYDPAHPAVLRLINEVIAAGRRHEVPVAMCGEMAADSRCVPLLVGMGMRELSMLPAALLDVREQIGELDAETLEQAASEVFSRPGLVDPLGRFEQLIARH
jgi:phosphotransferase system enzyme I (PtsI)